MNHVMHQPLLSSSSCSLSLCRELLSLSFLENQRAISMISVVETVCHLPSSLLPWLSRESIMFQGKGSCVLLSDVRHPSEWEKEDAVVRLLSRNTLSLSLSTKRDWKNRNKNVAVVLCLFSFILRFLLNWVRAWIPLLCLMMLLSLCSCCFSWTLFSRVSCFLLSCSFPWVRLRHMNSSWERKNQLPFESISETS